jgi:hypothetical protein
MIKKINKIRRRSVYNKIPERKIYNRKKRKKQTATNNKLGCIAVS